MAGDVTAAALLRDNNLTVIPKYVLVKCSEIRILDLSENPGICLRNSLRQFTNATKLLLEECDLVGIPDEAFELLQLEELSLSGNNFYQGLNPAIGRLDRLKALHLQKCELTSVPDAVGDLARLEELFLWDNNFSSGLNPAMRLLRRLKKLYLFGCKLTSLPDWIGDLEQIEELSIAGNNFCGGLNPAIEPFRRLKKLDIGGCDLTHVPDWIGDLELLEELSMPGNDLSGGISSAIGRLQRLQKLDVRRCKLTSLPTWVGDMNNLSTIFLTYNQLEDYPRCTLSSKSLRKLDVSNDDYGEGNRITSLPIELAYTNLVELKLDGNPIVEPPEEIWSLGLDAIKSFMRAVIPGGELMHADTLNVIGDTGAGKTSLVQSLIAQSPKPTAEADRTRVLQQSRMEIDQSSGQSVIINDFGGHEVYHSVMPIFLPANGLIILVYNMAEEMQEQAVKKWMLTAIAKCADIRLIIVGTHADLVASERRSTLEEQIETFSSDLLRNAIGEVDVHINYLECRSENNHMEDKLSDLRLLRKNLQCASICVVTLSCFVEDDGLSRLDGLVANSLRPPETLPVRWCRAINEILNQSPECFYITMEQIKLICRAHFTDADDSEAITTILRYLCKTSQIIWLESHPLLRNVVFHSPQKIIDLCKKILHHDDEVECLLLHYHLELEEYRNGILHEPLLKQMLSMHTENFKQNTEQCVSDARNARPSDVVVNFLQQFNLISYVRTGSKGREFVVPCKLTSAEPQKLQELEEKGSKCLNRVTVRLSFIGSIIPKSLFETSLSSMLNVAGDLAQHSVNPDFWKDGIIILHDGVCFFAKRIDAVIIFTAFSQPSDPSPWTILQPILKGLNDKVIASWQGAPPRCAISCPCCARHNQLNECNSALGEIQIDLAKLLAHGDKSSARPTCKTCMRTLPRSLCFPTEASGSFTSHQHEIETFFRNCDLKRPKVTKDDGPQCKYEKLEDMDIEKPTAVSDLARKFAKARPQLVQGLDRASINHVIDVLLAARDGHGLITDHERQLVQAELTDQDKARRLLDNIGKRGDAAIRVLAEALASDNCSRHDLAVLLSFEENMNEQR